MKRTLSLFALLAMSAPLVSAATVYTIHLSNAERFSDCTIIYRSDTTTKFKGINRNGKEVIKEIPTTSIMYMAEVERPDAPKDEQSAPTPEAPKQEATTEQPPTPAPAEPEKEDEEKAGEQPAAPESDARPAPPAPQQEYHDANVHEQEGTNKAKDITLRLRTDLQKIDAALADVSTPSRSLRSICDSTRQRVNSQLKNMDQLSLEVVDLQTKFNSAGIAEYQFLTKPDEREKFLHDATAAYNAMIIDMNERKSRRKIGGLDKFEIMHQRYQGAPEYKNAHARYIKTLKELHKKWSRMQFNEKNKRKKLPDTRAAAMVDSDDAEFAKMESYFQREGEDIAKIWYTPSPRNLKMLNNCINKINDNLRRNEYSELDREAGCVPELLTRYWKLMDDTRNLLVCGKLEAAEAMLTNDHTLQAITRLKATTMPQEYRKPLTDENRAMLAEIRKRIRDRRTLKTNLERKTSQLDRAVSAAESQINNALDAIEREKAMQTEDHTLEIVGEEKKQPAVEQKPATPAPAPEGQTPPAPAAK